MQYMLSRLALVSALSAICVGFANDVTDDDTLTVDWTDEGHHHHHKHHKHHKPNHEGDKAVVATTPSTVVKAAVQAKATSSIVDKMKKIEAKLAAKAKAVPMEEGRVLVNGPLPADFNERFIQAVAHATGTDTSNVQVKDATALEDNPDIVEVTFMAPSPVVKAVQSDVADPGSKLANGNLRPFLVAKDSKEASSATNLAAEKPESKDHHDHDHKEHADDHHHHDSDDQAATPVEDKGIDIDTAMPYGDLEPFGREDTAQELTESSVKESDGMVDQLERAEVAEEKRAVFRALTRLRGAAITSFDGVARSQTGNIDEYNKVHKWRNSHPLHHLADEESDVQKWAFPDNADF